TDKAMETIGGVPEKFRRPYYRWTEADILCTAGQFETAKTILAVRITRFCSSASARPLSRIMKIQNAGKCLGKRPPGTS
ncbi:MAG: hypothetical protein AB7U43_05305, partial [Desulfobacter sp.]